MQISIDGDPFLVFVTTMEVDESQKIKKMHSIISLECWPSNGSFTNTYDGYTDIVMVVAGGKYFSSFFRVCLEV